jgi:hypothetical protein
VKNELIPDPSLVLEKGGRKNNKKVLEMKDFNFLKVPSSLSIGQK